jgi:CRP-like cAMP-binding protein
MPMTRTQRIARLKKVALFAGLAPRAVASIADLATEIEYPAGHYIVRQGQVGTGFYLISSGRAKVVRGSNVIAHLGPGDFFGELSVLDQSPRMAHVLAEESTSCLALASWDLTRLLERSPKVTIALLRVVASRLRAVSDHHTS